MDKTKVMEIIGQLYTRVYFLEDENKNLKLQNHQLEEQLGLAKENGSEPKRTSDK